MAKAKKPLYRQLDISKALKNKDEFIEVEVQSNNDTKKVSLFDFVNDIRKFKSGTLLDDTENLKEFNPFMVLKTLSMKEDDIILCNYLNKYQNTLNKEQFYQALLHLIDRDTSFYRFVSNKDVENQYLEHIISFFKCSTTEAKLYYDTFGKEWAEKIKDKMTSNNQV